MSAELVELLSEKGENTGRYQQRDLVHKTGEWHGSVHVWLAEGTRVLLQKRALNKESYPGLYDVSAAGHICAGESHLEAAARETGEELGIHAERHEFQYLGMQKLCIRHETRGFISNAFNHIYLLKARPDFFPLVPDHAEIESLHWMEISEVETDLRRGDPRYCIPYSEAKQVFDLLSG